MNFETATVEFIDRKEQINIAKVLGFGRQRAADLAHTLSKKGAYMASAELVNLAVDKLINLVYEDDETGCVNRCPHSGQIVIPSPWGRNGRYKFGLRATEADVLRIHLIRLQEILDPAPLFTYDPLCRRWFVNHFDHPVRNDALLYWRKVQLDSSTYRAIAETMRN